MRVEELKVNVYAIPTDRPEDDGAFRWDSMTIVLIDLETSELQEENV